VVTAASAVSGAKRRHWRTDARIIAFDLDLAFDSDFHSNSCHSDARAKRDRGNLLSQKAPRVAREVPIPNTEAKPRSADGTARAKCVGAIGCAQGKLRSLPA
jgi:hypothetical protein